MYVCIYIYTRIFQHEEGERECVCYVTSVCTHTGVCVLLYASRQNRLQKTLAPWWHTAVHHVDRLPNFERHVSAGASRCEFWSYSGKGNWHMRGRFRFMAGISESKIWRAWLGWHCLLGESADTAVRGFAFMLFSLLSRCISKRSASPVTQASKSQNTKRCLGRARGLETRLTGFFEALWGFGCS